MSVCFRTARMTAFLGAILALASTSLAAPGNPSKPNIVLVLMDNFGYGEPGVYGGGVLRGAKTPRIDSLASEGFRSANYNVEAECTPSRAAPMTGRYGIRTRLQKDGPPRDIPSLSSRRTMGAKVCRDRLDSPGPGEAACSLPMKAPYACHS